ncbi:MAG: arginine repressor [Microthrixaceae bacterium]
MGEPSTRQLSKHQRQHRIAALLGDARVTSQGQLAELLAAEGIDVNPSTVSRDLDELGAVKVRIAGGEAAYVIPELPRDQLAPADHLRRVLGEWVVEVARSGHLVVLSTPPGCAHVVGSAVDRSGLAGILGTVAGDDTLLVIAAEDPGGAQVAEDLAELAGLTGDGRRSGPMAGPVGFVAPAQRPSSSP